MHGAFLEDQEGKMSKSKGDFLTLTSLIERGFEPEHYRYFCLQGHYRKPLKFSMSLLENAKRDFETLRMAIVSLKNKADDAQLTSTTPEQAELMQRYSDDYWDCINDDLDTASAVKIFKKVLSDKTLSPHEKLTLLYEFDSVFGLSIENFKQSSLSRRQHILIEMRNSFRQQGRFAQGDVIRKAFQQQGFSLYDESSEKTLCIANKIEHAPRASVATARNSLFASSAAKAPTAFASEKRSADDLGSALDDDGPVATRRTPSPQQPTCFDSAAVDQRLFENKKRSPADQQAFDQRFGLVIRG